jgi:putative oxidoreductase
MMTALGGRVEPLLATLTRAQWLPLLAMRLFIGYLFVETGLGKIGNLGVMATRFADWGIPWPAFNAVLSGYTELIGGALVVLGLATRLAAIPLAVNMTVATAAVKMKGVESLDDFVELDEPLYALVFVWLVFSGPGRISLDHAIRRRQAAADGRPPA